MNPDPFPDLQPGEVLQCAGYNVTKTAYVVGNREDGTTFMTDEDGNVRDFTVESDGTIKCGEWKKPTNP